MVSQEMRSTQLLFNHGPGSILETVNGPVVVQKWSSFLQQMPLQAHNFPQAFEIRELRLSDQLYAPNGQAHLHRIPSNAEVGLPADRYLLRTNRFPDWLICNRSATHGGHAMLFNHGAVAGQNTACPTCGEQGAPLRFVTYCTNGHLDDVDWRYHVCGPDYSNQCATSSYQWHERNASMAGVDIVCNHCRSRKNLAEIARNIGRCSGRHPEELFGQHNQRPRNCTAPVKITQRQSSVLWQSQTSRVITVPTEDPMTKYIEKLFLNQLRNNAPFDSFLIFPGEDDCTKFLAWLENYRYSVPPQQQPDFHRFRNRIKEGDGFDEFRSTWEALVSGRNQHAIIESYRREMKGLVESERPCELPNSQRGYDFVLRGDHQSGDFGRLRMKVEPIERLRTVTALTGFSRGAIGDLNNQTPPRTVPLHYSDQGGTDWYAAAEAFGEGLLITFDGEQSNFDDGQRWKTWEAHHQTMVDDAIGARQQPVPWVLFRSTAKALALDEEWVPDAEVAGEYFAEAHPLFVWWHTFAHHFIRAVQAETGYSSSAISERIYASPVNGTWKGAILLYVTEGGMDGTLGGLTSLYTHFQTFLDRMLEEAEVCSMDPLCEEAPNRMMSDLGCYACTFNPETSCEHRNMFLDRLLMLEVAGE